MPLACWAKKAHLAFARLLEMLTEGERSCDHATPRQVALREEEIVESPTAMDSTRVPANVWYLSSGPVSQFLAGLRQQ